MADLGFIAGVKRELRQMTSRRMYLWGIIMVPVLVALFFVGILSEGLPEHIPTAVVDLDHSPMSRAVTRSLKAMQVLDITEECESYDQAIAEVRKANIMGFFVIPANFEKNALSMEQPTLEYYTNMTYFVPGTLAFKGFKTVAVATAAGVVTQTLESLGLTSAQASSVIQPIDIDIHPIGNPWMNYGIYLCPSFCYCTLVLMIMLMTAFSVTMEIKNGTSVQWLSVAKGRISVALLSKLLPQTVIWFIDGIFITSLLFRWCGFPFNGSMAWFMLALLLTVIASQSFSVFVCSVVPNPRLSFITNALFGILTFSFAALSFPVQSMYGYIAVFSWLAPFRYLLLIYFNLGLNGIDIYYSRLYMAALLIFPIAATLLLGRLRRACLNPVYVP